MNQKISAVLWNIDGTLLNFPAAEEAAIHACFERFGLGECTKDMLRRYSAINLGYWKMIERSEIDKGRALAARFEDFFAEYGLPVDVAAAFNDEYQIRLGDTVVFEPGALEAVSALRGLVKQYAVTNGTRTAQRRKLKNSGLDALLDGVFISEEIGVEKPGEAFFDYLFDHIEAPREETVIIGDSLTSDMLGGERAGIRCWWYNPQGAARVGHAIDWEIRDLAEIPDLVRAQAS
ncbi:MAG: YjjG family noncanonical pyrimidine nucleotidase [Clostridia bacterium]|nr:YjjG family noncanonical pyrimidine nucleotidase [Clostridia bacterium]